MNLYQQTQIKLATSKCESCKGSGYYKERFNGTQCQSCLGDGCYPAYLHVIVDGLLDLLKEEI